MKRFNEFRLYEFEERQKMSTPEQISFMDQLYDRVKKDIIPNIPKEFKVDYDRGNKITIHTNNERDMMIGAKVSDDKMILFSKPIGEPEFEVNYDFQSANVDNVISSFQTTFDRSETHGIDTGKGSRYMKSFRDDDDEEIEHERPQDDQDDIDVPITEKPKRIKRSIDIKTIRNVLEDAYILDEIDLIKVTSDELIRRMLVESRKKR